MRHIEIDSSGVQTTAYSGTLQENRAEVLGLLSEAFARLGKNNTLVSSLGFRVDNRWGDRLDIHTMMLILEVGEDFHQFKDSSGAFHEITREGLETIIQECKVDIASTYAKKWDIEARLQAGMTIEEVWSVYDDTISQLLD